MAFSFGQSVQFRANDRRRGSYISRQNDPAYNREVQYTHSDLTVRKFSDANALEIVRMLCKEKNLQIPDHVVCTWYDKTINLNTAELNSLVEIAMDHAVPLPKPQIKTE